ncbi:MAG: glycosyltransferase [Mangrovibacterium sp.]
MPGFFISIPPMSFASYYIETRVPVVALIHERPSERLGIVVMIPACNEPELLRTIGSLSCCEVPRQAVEVIVVVNEAEGCQKETSLQNDRSILLLEEWKSAHPEAFFNLYPVRPDPFPKKHAGVGLARKTGMDEAVRRFDQLKKPEGVIVSLDADTLVEGNYLTEIEKLFYSDRKPTGATIRFEHRINELQDEQQREGIMLYETYLRYYKQALEFCRYPHAIYTIGSAFAVRADAYVKQGGMNQRQAGEDFYFLHKLTQLGPLAELNTTYVYPSARVSDRVPFGTGAALQKWMKGDSRLRYTYCFRSFSDLRQFFGLIPLLYSQDWDHHTEWGIALPLLCFLEKDHFPDALSEIRRNSSSLATFEKRFFQYFNAFKILKFQNFSHTGFYEYQDLYEAISDLNQAKTE